MGKLWEASWVLTRNETFFGLLKIGRSTIRSRPWPPRLPPLNAGCLFLIQLGDTNFGVPESQPADLTDTDLEGVSGGGQYVGYGFFTYGEGPNHPCNQPF